MGMPVPPVRVAEAIVQNVPYYLNGLGTVQPSGDVLVQSRVDGQLIKLHFKDGQRVRAGDLLAEIDPRPFQTALEQAKGNLVRDRAQLENARRDLERYAKLAKGDYIAEQQYENQKALVKQYQGTVESDQAAVASAQLQLDYSRVKAPISGRLGLRAVDEGNQVKANDAEGIVRITETHPCDVIFTIPESQAPIVARALHAREKDHFLAPLMAQAWDREQKKLLATGELVSLDNKIDAATGTVRLKARFPNNDEHLFPNQFVNVRLLVETLRDAVTVPASGVQLGSKGSYSYVLEKKEEKEIAIYREITPGITVDNVTVIDSGISAGDIVVVDGVDRLRDDMPVRIAARMETPLIPPPNAPQQRKQPENTGASPPVGGSNESAPL